MDYEQRLTVVQRELEEKTKLLVSRQNEIFQKDGELKQKDGAISLLRDKISKVYLRIHHTFDSIHIDLIFLSSLLLFSLFLFTTS